MSVNITNIDRPAAFSHAELRWRDVPVAIAVDIDPAACQIDPDIRPINPPGRQPRLFGRAVTVECHPPDFGAVLHAIEEVGPGDVLVISASGHRETAMIGGIVSGELKRRGAAGVICDGAVRDVAELADLRPFSVFTRHITPRGPTGANHGSVNAPVHFAGLTISPGDLIIGDDDGLCRLTPNQVEAFIEPAEAKLKLEAEWVARLESGESVNAVFSLSS